MFGVILVAVEALQRRPAGRLPCETEREVPTCFHVLAARPVAILAVVTAVEGITERGVDVVMADSTHVASHPIGLGVSHLE